MPIVLSVSVKRQMNREYKQKQAQHERFIQLTCRQAHGIDHEVHGGAVRGPITGGKNTGCFAV